MQKYTLIDVHSFKNLKELGYVFVEKDTENGYFIRLSVDKKEYVLRTTRRNEIRYFIRFEAVLNFLKENFVNCVNINNLLKI